MQKKVISIILTIIMLFSCAGCENSGSSSSKEAGSITEHEPDFSYVNESIAEFRLDGVLTFNAYEDELILVGYANGTIINGHGSEEWALNIKVIDLTVDGQLRSEAEFTLPANDMTPLSADIAEDGSVWILCTDGNLEEKTYSVECYDRNGEHIDTIIPDLSGFITKGGLKLVVCKNISFFISADDLENSYAAFYDEEGNSLYEIEGLKGLCELLDGRLIAKRVLGSTTSFSEIDIEAQSFGKEYTLELDMYAYYNGGNANYEMLEVSPDAVYAYQLSEGKRTKLFDWVSQGIFYTNTSRQVICLDEYLYGIDTTDSVDERMVRVLRFTQTELQHQTTETKDGQRLTASGKKIIQVSAFQSSTTLKESATTFNKINPEYEVQIKIYGDNEDAFNMDIISNNIPDVFFLGQEAPLEYYSQKGLLTDLYEFMDNDPETCREDYVESVLKVLEEDGKLYGIPERFLVNTVVGRVSDVGTDTGWTWEDLNGLMGSKAVGTIPMARYPLGTTKPKITCEDFFNQVFATMGSIFIDYKEKKSYFETAAFTELLKNAKFYYPQGVDYEVTEEAFLAGNPMLMICQLRSFDAQYTTGIELRYLGEEISYIGYPSMNGAGGSGFEFYNLIAISAKSDMKEGAWEYLKFVLTDYQHHFAKSNEISNHFPINRSALEEYAQKELIPYYGPDGYTDMYGNYYRDPTEKDIQKIYDLIDSITVQYTSTYKTAQIYQIVEEEVSSYFNNHKTAEEVAAIIQNRVGLFLMELD